MDITVQTTTVQPIEVFSLNIMAVFNILKQKYEINYTYCHETGDKVTF